jgi:hypothetical protein
LEKSEKNFLLYKRNVMKKLFLALMLASATSLFAFSSEQINPLSAPQFEQNQANIPHYSFQELECKKLLSKHCHDCYKKHDGVAYGSFFTEDGASLEVSSTPIVTDVDPGQAIVLNRESISTKHVTLLPGGIIRIDAKGDYLVNFGASVTSIVVPEATPQQPDPFQIALELNAMILPGSNISTDFSSEIFSGSTTIHVTGPSTLKIINNGSASFKLSSDIPGNVTAFLTINKLHNAPPPE